MRYTGPKAKLCRRIGINLFGTEKYNKILRQKNAKPGIHGAKQQFRKLSEYGRQLQEKQKAKIIFDISEKQFSNYFKKAARQSGATGTNLLCILERRLDKCDLCFSICRNTYAGTSNG